MAVNDKKDPLDQLNRTLGAYNQAGQRADSLQRTASQIPIPAPIVREGRGTVTSTSSPATNAAVLANQTLGARANAAREAQVGVSRQLAPLTAQVRQQTAQTRARTATQGANAVLAGVGAAGIPAAPATAAPAAPRAAFGNVLANVRTLPGARPAQGAVDSAAAPGAPAPVRGLRTLSGTGNLAGMGQPDDQVAIAGAPRQSLASSRGQFGENVYDNASIERLTGQPIDQVREQAGTTIAPTQASAIAPTNTQVPNVALPRSLSGDLTGTEQERKSALEDIDSQIRTMAISPNGMNSRGKRELYSTLLAQRNALTGKRIDQVTDLESRGAELADRAAAQQAQLQGQAIEGNANRALDADRFNMATQDRAADRAAEGQRVSRTLVDRNGNTSVLSADGAVRQLTGPDGQPFQEAQDPQLLRQQQVSPDAEFKALSEQLLQLQQLGRPEDKAEATQYDQQLAALTGRMDTLTGKAPAAGGKTVKRTGTLNGRRVVEYTDGTTEYAD